MLLRQKSSHPIFWLLLVSAALTSCAAPIATATVTSRSTRGPTATSTLLPTLTPSLTPSPIPGADWIGQWNIYINGNQEEWLGNAEFFVDGESIGGAFTIFDAEDGSLFYEFTGYLDSSYLIATGTWKLITKNAGEGPFKWRMSSENPNQFSGNLEEGKFQFCGWREGEDRPSPCEWP